MGCLSVFLRQFVSSGGYSLHFFGQLFYQVAAMFREYGNCHVSGQLYIVVC